MPVDSGLRLLDTSFMFLDYGIYGAQNGETDVK